MKKLILIVIFFRFVLFVFPQQGTQFLNGNKQNIDNDSLIEKYVNIIEGLNLNYVLWYPRYHSIHPEPSWDINISYSEFVLDSITYWKCYDDFFNEDLKIVFWLLSFKKDESEEHPLWQLSSDPMSSYIGECDWNLSNTRSAIILVENYLEGKGFKCYECYNHFGKSCNKKKYKQVEKFLKTNKNKSIVDIRYEWKKTNAR